MSAESMNNGYEQLPLFGPGATIEMPGDIDPSKAVALGVALAAIEEGYGIDFDGIGSGSRGEVASLSERPVGGGLSIPESTAFDALVANFDNTTEGNRRNPKEGKQLSTVRIIGLSAAKAALAAVPENNWDGVFSDRSRYSKPPDLK